MLERHWHQKPLVLLDEYDTPMQEAWLSGYWDQMAAFQRNLFNATFKTNPALGRGLITGVTRVSREFIFSDLNNVSMVTTSTPLYQDCFGFTQDEVLNALGEFGLQAQSADLKSDFETLLSGGSIQKQIDEQVVFSELETTPNAIWSLLLAAGYARPEGPLAVRADTPQPLRITNHETMFAFDTMLRGWFTPAPPSYNRFAQALLA